MHQLFIGQLVHTTTLNHLKKALILRFLRTKPMHLCTFSSRGQLEEVGIEKWKFLPGRCLQGIVWIVIYRRKQLCYCVFHSNSFNYLIKMTQKQSCRLELLGKIHGKFHNTCNFKCKKERSSHGPS